MTQIHVRVHRATFVADNMPDTEVRILPDTSGVSFAINFGSACKPIESGHIPVGSELQLSESLQFVADTIGATVPGRLSPFVRGWINVAADVNHTAHQKGFWEDWEDGVERNDAEMLCLIHSEISEALEALRRGNPPDDKIPEYSGAEAELADVVIRIMDLAHARGWRVAQAIEAKMRFNAGRPYKHGKQF
jgi:NTP pyrophosphatase (non-canonical NTP hydrolase)